MSRSTIRPVRQKYHTAKIFVMIENPDASTRLANAGDEIAMPIWTAASLFRDAPLENDSRTYSADIMAIQTAKNRGSPWVQTSCRVGATGRSQRLGILYILYALRFLDIEGLKPPSFAFNYAGA